jgi:hypothetical protein
MSMQSKIVFALAFLLVVIGVCLDGESYGAGGTCDGLCHARDQIMFCASGHCAKFAAPTCVVCPKGPNFLCLSGGTGTANSCVTAYDLDGKPYPNAYNRYNDCTALCNCTSATTSEANNMGTWNSNDIGVVDTCTGP